MPLEQIGSAVALNSFESQRRSSFFDYSPPTPLDLSDNEDKDDRNDSDHESEYTVRLANSSRRNTDTMSLAKLGGVGGVTRSGSWGRHSIHGSTLSDHDRDRLRATDSPKLVKSSLSSYSELPGDEDDQALDSTETATRVTFSSLNARASTSSSSSDPYRRSSESSSSTCRPNETLETSAIRLPSPSSRTSTASSAAAFSLRSLSHRDSNDSESSAASSSRSPDAQDPVITKSISASPSSFNDELVSGTQPLAWTVTDVKATSDITEHESDFGSEASTASGSDSDSPTRRLHRDSIPPPSKFEFNSLSQENAHQRQQQTFISPKTQETSLHGDNNSSSEDKSTPAEGLGDAIQMVPRPAKDLVASINLSPPPHGTVGTVNPTEMQASPEELLSISNTSVFSPLLPRRHSGMFMLRSRSQLAMHPTLNMAFTGAGGGRAAARDRARKHTGWENAPFSVLEAQRHARGYGFSQPASPGSDAAISIWDPSTSSPSHWKAASAIEASSRTQSPKLPNRLSEHASPPLAQQPDTSGRNRPSPMRQRSEYSLSRSALSRIDTELGLLDATLVPLPSSAGAASNPLSAVPARASIARSPSNSILSGSSLLRTPTTEEWSRLLESQGVEFAGRRSRTGTSRSTGSAAHLVGRLALSGLQSTSRTDLSDDDSDLDSDDSDDLDLGVEVLEKLKQLGLSCATSRSGSVIGEDLGSLDEEDEDNFSPVSPQVNKLLALSDATPLTPLASSSKALHPDDSPLRVVDDKLPIQTPLDRGTTVRLPRSKRPTVAGDALPNLQMQRPDSRVAKSINDYDVVSDVGRGAYGLVKKARKRGATGSAEGEVVVIKYIIKSRILADCWRRHRVLGPIPVEIHVMDQLRRIHYNAPLKSRPWSPSRPKTLEEWRQRKRDDTASVTAATVHPNICKMIDFFEDHEFYYLVMPCFGKGQDLFDHVENAPDGLAIVQSRSIFGQVADALWFLHLNNIVHRDIKDENVILDGEGNAQLIDFGSAAHVRPGKLFDTFSGTLDYAAAEILQGEKYSGQPQDIWALGVVGFVLLCGECPFWNGEEAIQGLKPGTRAAHTLEERCLLGRETHPGNESDTSINDEDEEMPPVDPACPPQKGRDGAEPDGGGRVDDFADLISRCLENDPETRPTAGQICQHRFLAGQQGWTGALGWQRLKVDIVPSCCDVAVKLPAA